MKKRKEEFVHKRKAFTVDADEFLSEKFSKQVLDRGYTKYRAIEGAMRLWLNLPTEMQATLIENPDLDMKDISDFLARRLRTALRQSLSHAEQQAQIPGEK